ncbi:hypothetical protein Tco_0285022 [Tanacetum coccineum]
MLLTAKKLGHLAQGNVGQPGLQLQITTTYKPPTTNNNNNRNNNNPKSPRGKLPLHSLALSAGSRPFHEDAPSGRTRHQGTEGNGNAVVASGYIAVGEVGVAGQKNPANNVVDGGFSHDLMYMVMLLCYGLPLSDWPLKWKELADQLHELSDQRLFLTCFVTWGRAQEVHIRQEERWIEHAKEQEETSEDNIGVVLRKRIEFPRSNPVNDWSISKTPTEICQFLVFLGRSTFHEGFSKIAKPNDQALLKEEAIRREKLEPVTDGTLCLNDRISSMSDSEDSTVTYTEISSPYEDLSDIGSPGAEGPIFQDPPSPDYVPGPEEPEQAPPSPIYPLPVATLPTTESPGYIPESDLEEGPEEDDKEDPKEDPADYPADRGDDRDDEEPSDNDDDDDAEEEEHLAHADPAAVAYSADQDPYLAYCVTARMSIRPQAPTPFLSKEVAERLLALPTPPPSPLSPYSSPLPQIPSSPLPIPSPPPNGPT